MSRKSEYKLTPTIVAHREYDSRPVLITDPCYSSDCLGLQKICNVKPGRYTCVVWYSRSWWTDENGKRHSNRNVMVAGIYLEGVEISKYKEMTEEIGAISVDAGVAGFFQDKPDYSDAEWGELCNQFYSGRNKGWLNRPEGFFTNSGYGDGCYGVYALKEGDDIVALEIRF